MQSRVSLSTFIHLGMRALMRRCFSGMNRSLGMDLGGDPGGINGFLFFYSWSSVGFVVVSKTSGGERDS